jgi:hypothetical protein
MFGNAPLVAMVTIAKIFPNFLPLPTERGKETSPLEIGLLQCQF